MTPPTLPPSDEHLPATPEVCVGAIAVEDGRLLLIRRGHGPAQGAWSVPGGRVEAGETLAEAVVRELAEETGLEGVCGEMIGWVERIGESHHHVILDFRVEVLEGTEPKAGDDAAEARWIPLPEGMPSAAFADKLIEDEGVIVLPGSAFGAGGEGFFRISFIAGPDRIAEAAKRAGRVLAAMGAAV